MDELLSGEAARRLRVHPITISRMAASGRLKFRLNDHGWKLFNASEIEAMAKKRVSKQTLEVEEERRR
jgi:hypothetical protein